MSNALQRDLLRMAARVEREDGPKAAQDPHRLTFHIQPAPAGSTIRTACASTEKTTMSLPVRPVRLHGRCQALGSLQEP